MNNYKTLEELIIKYDKKVMKLEQENKQLKENKKELIEFLKEYDKYRDSFKWNEQDYIDTIEKIKEILEEERMSKEELTKEIKEILNYFRKYMSIKDCIKLSKIEDYITNLQEERNMFKDSFETMSKNYFEEKSRIAKTIKLIKKALVETDITGNGTLNLSEFLSILGDEK